MKQTTNLSLKKHEGTDSAPDMLDYANDNADAIDAALGAKLSTLATGNKTLVGAINEVKITYESERGAAVSTLATGNKTLVGAINEVKTTYESERPIAQSVSSTNADREFTLDATAGLWALYAKGVTANVGGIWLISSSSGTASSFKIGGSSSLSTTVSGNKVTFKTDSNYYRLYLVRLM